MLEMERRSSEAAFLSSGVDSSLIAFGIHAKKTFSVAYEEQEFDESPLAMQAAKQLGSEHHVVKIGPADYFSAVDEALACRGLPTGDASYIALYIAAKEASSYTDAVCSGEGPDEMFCGYPCYSNYFDNPSEDYWLRINTIMDVGEIPSLPDYGGDGFLKMNAFDLTAWMTGNILPNVAAAAKGAGLDIHLPYMR
jgi:asparagine synthase (glutamine-hydrolysing)